MKLKLRYFCASLLILMSGVAFAQPPAECIALDVDFSAEISAGSRLSGKAVVTVQDTAFKMEGNGIEAYCDGVSLWTLDRAGKEVYIESVTPDTEDYMQNLKGRLLSLAAGSETSFLSPGGQTIKIKVNSMKKSAGKDVSSFRPTQDFDSSWVVTDLR